MTPATTRNAGAIALKRLGKREVTIAKELGVSQSTVHRWIDGSRKPAKAQRKKILQKYGIAVDLWDSEPPKRGRPKKEKSPESGRELALRMRAMIGDSLDDISVDPSPDERVQVIERCARALVSLGKVTGESTELTMAMVLASPIWRRIEDVFVAALEPWPEAARAIADALASLE